MGTVGAAEQVRLHHTDADGDGRPVVPIADAVAIHRNRPNDTNLESLP